MVEHIDSCPYLEIRYCYENEVTDCSAVMIHISDGCAHPFWRNASPVKLEWAEGSTAQLLGNDLETPILVFDEPLYQFQYFVFSEEPLSSTLQILESMN